MLIGLTIYVSISILANYISPVFSTAPPFLISPAFIILTVVVFMQAVAIMGLWKCKTWGLYLYLFAAFFEMLKVKTHGFLFAFNVGLFQLYVTLFGTVTLNLVPVLIVVVLFYQSRNFLNNSGSTSRPIERN